MIDYNEVLSKKLLSVKPSGIRKFFDILEEMDDVISLGVGEPDFVTPWHIRDAGIYSLEQGFTKYTSNAGMATLRQAVSSYMKRRFGLVYSAAEEILITVGGSEAIDLSLRALLEPGDEVIIPTPSFVCYEPLTIMADGIPVIVETQEKNEFRLTSEELMSAITPRTKIIVLPYPCNPTGSIMREKDLKAIADIIKDTNIVILSDEIYSELTYGQKHCSPANLPELRERTIVVNGFSKSFAMTGWRLGFVMGPLPILRELIKLHQFAIMCAPTTSQYAAIEALNEGDNDIENMRREYNQRRLFLVDGLRKIGLSCFEPRGAFYVFPCIKGTGLASDEFCERFLIEEKVAVISGTAFGSSGEGYVRMCYASTMENLRTTLERLGSFISRLK